ncbi:prolyl oligopeptidase family serine peptidase [Telmatocola sphagniphila]|uniref:Prolyl oligopeptidase family serine peptidase n=1 Tax=Telmatocola sphagniphila TaxID=1123043 RepID=A0A8E6B4C0_9BACT|nr:prolyl oligopeptidase family serine peptidase [Telmatocola sphagniphila]QVL30125.1 prolyl oligopeptidase family serine peptidase [Telmatocola sphagniphila]
MHKTHVSIQRRRKFFLLLPLLIGFSLGFGGPLRYLHGKTVNAVPVEFKDFQQPPQSDINTAARQVAEKILEGIAKKDASLIARHCTTPFLGGSPHLQKILTNEKDLAASLKTDLCEGPYMPYMFEPKWEITATLTPAEFRREYADYLTMDPETLKALEKLKLTARDRVVVEKRRGMLVLVRSDKGGSRAIGIVTLGFGPPPFKLTRDVIYRRRHGVALTLSVVQPPKNANGAAIILPINDSFVSFPRPFNAMGLGTRQQGLLDAGFTLIFVTPGSAPKHTIPEILSDIHTAVKYVRYNADQFQIDPDRLAIMGASSGGYISLMLGLADGKGPTFPPDSDPSQVFVKYDPLENVSSRVQAVISMCPPTDWLNYGEKGKSVLEFPLFQPYVGLLDLYEYDLRRNGYNKISDREKHLQELKKLSPVHLATAKAAPIMFIHGDKDLNVPIQHSISMHEELKKVGAQSELITKVGADHGWPETVEETAMMVKWLNERMPAKK